VAPAPFFLKLYLPPNLLIERIITIYLENIMKGKTCLGSLKYTKIILKVPQVCCSRLLIQPLGTTIKDLSLDLLSICSNGQVSG
jgi:hypothetical protein